jgi:hypothetical protein
VPRRGDAANCAGWLGTTRGCYMLGSATTLFKLDPATRCKQPSIVLQHFSRHRLGACLLQLVHPRCLITDGTAVEFRLHPCRDVCMLDLPSYNCQTLTSLQSQAQKLLLKLALPLVQPVPLDEGSACKPQGRLSV